MRLHAWPRLALLALLTATMSPARAEIGSATLTISAVIEESFAMEVETETQPTAQGRGVRLKNTGNARSAVNVRIVAPKARGGRGPASVEPPTPAVLTSGRELSERGLTLPRANSDRPTVIEISAP